MKTAAIIQLLLIVVLFTVISSAVFFNDKTVRNMDTQITLDSLPTRDGNRPNTTNTNPHTQLTQQPEDISHVQALMDWAFTLGHIERKPSAISVPGAIAMCVWKKDILAIVAMPL